jgi:hypothetical protein
VLAGTATATPKTGDVDVETLRLIKVARDTAVKAHSQAMITLKATLVTARDELRAQLEPLTDCRLITSCTAFEPVGDLIDADLAMRYTLGCLARRWMALHDEIKMHSRHLKQRTAAAAPALVEAFGIGPDIAAELLIAAGDNTNRIRSEAALAKLCGACPIPASSGRTIRHRLNRGGNRQANAALFAQSSSGCAGTSRPSPTSNAAQPRACPSARSSAASSATSSARSTSSCPNR